MAARGWHALPPELRNTIYELVFADDNRAMILPQTFKPPSSKGRTLRSDMGISSIPYRCKVTSLCGAMRQEYLSMFLPRIPDIHCSHIDAVVEDFDFEVLKTEFLEGLTEAGRTRATDGMIDVQLSFTKNFMEHLAADVRHTSLRQWVLYQDRKRDLDKRVPVTYSVRRGPLLDANAVFFFLQSIRLGVYEGLQSPELEDIYAALEPRFSASSADGNTTPRTEGVATDDREGARNAELGNGD
jgi:hypothetical protein